MEGKVVDFWNEILLPLFIFIVWLGLLSWVGFLVYIGIKRLPKFNRWFKYKVLKREFPEKYVAWCEQALQGNFSATTLYLMLIKHGFPTKKADEVIYIYKELEKENMKGGENGRGR